MRARIKGPTSVERLVHRIWRIYNKLFCNLLGDLSCPVCGKRVCRFIPLSKFYTKNQKRHGYLYSLDDAETLNQKAYSCPHCDAKDRDRLFALFILRRVSRSDGMQILEIAPSKALSEMIRKHGKISLRTADLMMRGVDDHVDITDMRPYPNEAFDAFICSHVLEHVPDDHKALSELFRILKPNGWGIVMVPVILAADEIDEDPHLEDIGERWRRFGQYDHIRSYSKKGLVERIEAAGFIVKQYGKEYFGKDVFARHGISGKSVLYVAEKGGRGSEPVNLQSATSVLS
jgi:SAM-dependent methyltransferase